MTYEKFFADPDSLFLLECWARDGLTDAEICEKINISRETWRKWLQRSRENDNCMIDYAMTKGRLVADFRVESALLKRATGYTYEEKKIIYGFPDKDGNRPMRTEITERHIQPDVRAIMFWLNNRKPEKWKLNNDMFQISDNFAGSNVTINIQRNAQESIVPTGGVHAEEQKRKKGDGTKSKKKKGNN